MALQWPVVVVQTVVAQIVGDQPGRDGHAATGEGLGSWGLA